MKKSYDEREMTQEEAVHYQAPDDAESDFMFARGLRETEEIEERLDAQEHALEYLHECEALRREVYDLKRNHELEMARQEAQYQTRIADLKAVVFNISEMVEYVKNNFPLSSAKDFKTMCYRLFLNRGDRVDEETVKLLDGIDEAIRHREAKSQNVNFAAVSQVNINPQNVHNHGKEEK